MVRRSFRIGLRLGILAGVVWAVTKMLQSRQAEAPVFEPTPWTPAPEPSAPTPPPVAVPPSQPPAHPPVVEPRPSPAPAPAPRTPPPASRPPVRKAPAAKAPPKKAPAPTKAVKKAAKKVPPKPAWVEPVGNVCPPSHPIKVKLASRIFHVPGLLAYDRTNPDRCYTDERSAASDGFTRAKR